MHIIDFFHLRNYFAHPKIIACAELRHQKLPGLINSTADRSSERMNSMCSRKSAVGVQPLTLHHSPNLLIGIKVVRLLTCGQFKQTPF
jgi:hypothetical protein